MRTDTDENEASMVAVEKNDEDKTRNRKTRGGKQGGGNSVTRVIEQVPRQTCQSNLSERVVGTSRQKRSRNLTFLTRTLTLILRHLREELHNHLDYVLFDTLYIL